MGACNLPYNWFDGYATTSPGAVSNVLPTYANILNPLDAASVMTIGNQGLADTAGFPAGLVQCPIPETDVMLEHMRDAGAAWPLTQMGTSRSSLKNWDYTSGNYLGPVYRMESLNNYGITMNPSYRAFGVGDPTGAGVHLHGYRLRLRIVFPSMNPGIRIADYCPRRVSWRLVLLPRGEFIMDPQFKAQVDADADTAGHTFPPGGWAPAASTPSTGKSAFTTFDPLNCLFRAPLLHTVPKTYFDTGDSDDALTSVNLCGGQAYGTASRFQDYLRRKVSLRPPSDSAVGIQRWEIFRPYRPVVLDGGDVEESLYSPQVSTSFVAGPKDCEGSFPVGVGTSGTIAAVNTSIEAAKFPVVTSSAAYETRYCEESFHVVKSQKKFKKPLFVSYESKVAGERWYHFKPEGSSTDAFVNPSYVEFPTDDTFYPDIAESAFPMNDLYDPSILKSSPQEDYLDLVPSYASRIATDRDAGTNFTVHPCTNRLALFVWDNMPVSSVNTNRPRVVAEMVRYETDA